MSASALARRDLQLLDYQVIPHDDRRIAFSALNSGDYASCMAAGFPCANQWWLEANGGVLHESIRYRHVTMGPLVSLTFRISGVSSILLLGLAEGKAAQGIAVELDGNAVTSAPVDPAGVAEGILHKVNTRPAASHAVVVRYNGTDRLSIVALALDTSGAGLDPPTTSDAPLSRTPPAGPLHTTLSGTSRTGEPGVPTNLPSPLSGGEATRNTATPPAPGPSSSPRVFSTAGIAGSAAGGAIAVIILFLLVVCCIRLRRSGSAAPDWEVPPTTVDPYPIFASVSLSNLPPKHGLIEEVKVTDGGDELPVDGPLIPVHSDAASSPTRWGLRLLTRHGKKDRRGAPEPGPSDRVGQPPRYAA